MFAKLRALVWDGAGLAVEFATLGEYRLGGVEQDPGCGGRDAGHNPRSSTQHVRDPLAVSGRTCAGMLAEDASAV